MKQKLRFFGILLGMIALSIWEVRAQSQPMVVYDPSGVSITGNAFPFSSTTSNRRAWVFTPQDFSNAQPGFITRVYILVSGSPAPTYTNLDLKMGPATFANFSGQTAWPATATSVLSAATYTPATISKVGGSATGTWLAFDLQTPYLFDNITNFVVDVQQGGYTAGATTQQVSTNVTAKSLYGNAAAAPTGTQDRLAVFGFDWIPSGPCISPPVVGNANTSASTVCIGGSVTLGVDTLTFGQGQTYQWQSSANGTTWTNMLNDTLTSANATVLDTTFYRLSVTCGGVTSFSAPVQVFAIGTPLPGGVYTVNSLVPTGGTNFNKLSDFSNFVTCGGISGPVVLNFVPGTGPYTDQAVFDNIATSAVNTITINGNGETMQFGAGVTSERATLHLKGTSFVTIDSLNLVVSSTATFGYGLQISNGASNIIVRNSLIDNQVASTSSNFAGIVMGSGTTATGTGGLPATNVTIENNVILGGYYGITLIGSTAAPGLNNKILNNRIHDFYFYGVFSVGQTDFDYSGNDLARPLRSTLSSFYGLYFSQAHIGGRVMKNAIHDPFGQVTSTSVIYPMFSTSAAATAASPTLVYNNIFYNLRNNGTLYAIYNSSSSHWKYYHNSIDIDDIIPTAALTYAVYFLGTSDGIDFFNNVVALRRSGTSAKYAVYVTGTGTRNINNNAYHVDYNTGNSSFGFIGSARATFADWRANSSFDANSVFDVPNFIFPAGGLLIPAAASYDNIGQNLLSLVPTDYYDTTRTITPDPGAFEFQGPACGNPVSLDTVAITSTSITAGWIQPGTTVNTWDLEWGPPGFTIGTAGGGSATTTSNPYTITGLTPGACYDVYVRANCNAQALGTSGWTGPISVCLPYDFDVVLDALRSPSQPTGCGDSAMAVSVILFNNGIAPAANFPVTATVTGAATGTLNATYTGPLAPGAFDTLVVGTLNTFAGGAITIAVSVNWSQDQNPANNSATYGPINIVPGIPQFIPIAPVCAAQDSVDLEAVPFPGLTYQWYDSAVAGNLLSTGQQFTVPTTNPGPYWLQYASGGGKDSLETVFNGTTTTTISGHMFDVNILRPIFIESFDVHPSGTAVNSVHVYMKLGSFLGSENNPAAWTLVEIVNGVQFQGANTQARVPLSAPLQLNPGQVYGIYIQPMTTALRYTSGAAALPPGQVVAANTDLEILGSVAKGGTPPFGTSTLSPRLWNGRINYRGPDGCESPRVPVTFSVNSAVATASFTSNQTGPGSFAFDASASVGHLFTWDFGDGNNATGITTSHTYSNAGNFDVTLIVTDTACNTVDTLILSVTSTISLEEFEIARDLKIFPNPSTGVYNISFELLGVQEVYLRVLNQTGQIVVSTPMATGSNQFATQIDLSQAAKGVYLLQIQTEKGIVTRRLILQ